MRRLTIIFFFANIKKMIFVQNFFFQTISSILGLYLSAKFIPGVDFIGKIKIFILAGAIIGVANCFIKPILNFFLLPFRILTFGLIEVLINIAIISILVYGIFPNNFRISGFFPILWMTLIVSFFNALFFYANRRRHRD